MSARHTASQVRALRINRESSAETGWHSHREGQLYSLTAGLMTVETQRGALAMPAGRMGWIPGLHEHRARTYDATEGWSVYVSPDIASTLPTEPRVLQNSELVRALVARISSWGEDRVVTAADERLICVFVDELRANPEESLTLPFPKDRRLFAIASRLLGELDSDRQLEDWARWAGISSRSLIRGFKLETGLSFGRWRSLACMLQALEPLSRGVPVGEVAARVGYENTSAFISMFKSFFGTTPAAYFGRTAAGGVSTATRADFSVGVRKVAGETRTFHIPGAGPRATETQPSRGGDRLRARKNL
jgi:AraC-like DNA-binding protein